MMKGVLAQEVHHDVSSSVLELAEVFVLLEDVFDVIFGVE